MRDIGFVLNNIMRTNNCSPVCALFMLTEKDKSSELHKLQSEPSEETSRGLCNKSNIEKSK